MGLYNARKTEVSYYMKNLNKLEKGELIELVKKLQRRKKYGLVWEEKPEDVVEQCKKELPVLEEDAKRAIEKDTNGPTNLLIEGDNYHSLSVLNYTHAGKIDVIYIDPPYNTGARDWKYNNDYVDINDTYRHSKWISMMNNRLKIAKNLLKSNGVLICTIDKNENATILMLLAEVFPCHDIATVVIEHNPKGLPSKNFSFSHEYAHFVIPKGVSVIGKNPATKEDTRNLRRAGKASYRLERPTMFYPIYVKGGKVTGVGNVPEKSFHPKKRAIIKSNNIVEIWPIDNRGKERRWHFGLDSISDHLKRIEVKVKDDDYQLYVTAVPARYKTVWTGGELDAGKYGTTLVKEIIGKEFPFPKSLYATAKCLETVIHKREDSVVLDFFAGSGTTGHAVMLLNQKYGGNRKFILCTNNEGGIAKEVCYPRIKKAISGYDGIKGIPANLRYFKTAFVSKSKVSDDTRRELVKRSTEMICVRENTFEKMADNKKFKIFQDKKHATGILFNLDSIDEFKNKLKKQKMSVNIYVFSLTNDTFDEDFEDLGLKHKLCPIPESILEVYRKLFK